MLPSLRISARIPGSRGTVALLLGLILLLGAARTARAETYEHAVESTTGLAHFWPMGEASGASSFADAVGGANAEVLSGVTLGEPGGLVGDSSTSALFNGSSGAARASVDLSGTHRLTVEFWMKWSAFAEDDRLALEFTPNFNEYAGGFLVDPDASPGTDFAVSIGEVSSRNTVYFERPTAGAWHYYAFVLNTEAPAETEITPYVDGHAVSYTKTESGTGAGNFADSTLFWMSRDASTLFGAGSMQDLALYDTTLSFDKHLTGGPLHVKVARDVIPYNTKFSKLAPWLEAVNKAGLEPYITFGVVEECAFGKSCPAVNNPSVEVYGKDIEQLIKKVVEHHKKEAAVIPAVKRWGAWNEPDFHSNTNYDPLFEHAKKAALFWKKARSILRRVGCNCTMVAGEFAEYDSYIGRYIETIRHNHKFWSRKPGVWGFHDYHDLVSVTPRSPYTVKYAKAFARIISKGMGHPRIWFSEQGVELKNNSSTTPLDEGPEPLRAYLSRWLRGSRGGPS